MAKPEQPQHPIRDINKALRHEGGGGTLRCTITERDAIGRSFSRPSSFRVSKARTVKGVVQFYTYRQWHTPDPKQAWSIEDWARRYSYGYTPPVAITYPPKVPQPDEASCEGYIYNRIKVAITEEFPIIIVDGDTEINTQDIRRALMPIYEELANGYRDSHQMYVSRDRTRITLTPYLMTLLKRAIASTTKDKGQ
jgi:hypothetical protein